MIKKLILAGGAVALLSSVTVGVPLWSYARCGVNYLRDSASDSVPMEWELKRARQMIADLKPEIEANAKRIAREKIDVARLEKQAQETDERLAKTQADIERLSEDLRSGSNASGSESGSGFPPRTRKKQRNARPSRPMWCLQVIPT